MKHPKEFMHGDTRMVHCPIRIHWSYSGQSGIADHQAIAMVDEYTHEWCLSEYWWTEGNGSCDCNRGSFIGLTYEEFPELFHEEHHDDPKCGDKIIISRLESLDPLIPSLELPEGDDHASP